MVNETAAHGRCCQQFDVVTQSCPTHIPKPPKPVEPKLQEMHAEVVSVVNYGSRTVVATRTEGLFELLMDDDGDIVLVEIKLKRIE